MTEFEIFSLFIPPESVGLSFEAPHTPNSDFIWTVGVFLENPKTISRGCIYGLLPEYCRHEPIGEHNKEELKWYLSTDLKYLLGLPPEKLMKWSSLDEIKLFILKNRSLTQ